MSSNVKGKSWVCHSIMQIAQMSTDSNELNAQGLVSLVMTFKRATQ